MILLKNKIKLISGERGLALPLVLIVMLVLFILGTVLLQYAITEAVQVSRSEKRMQAHYLARSGLETMAVHLISNPTDLNDYIDETGTGSIPDSGGDFSVLVTEEADGKITIESTGQVVDNGSVIEEVLSLTLISTSAGLFEDAIFANNDLNISGMRKVYGDLSSNGNIIVGGTTRGVGDMEHPDQNRDYPEPQFPDDVPVNGIELNAGQNDETINENKRFTSIKNKNQSTITFDTNVGDLNIIVEGIIEIKGDYDIIGSNRVYIFLDGTGEMKTKNDSDYNPNQLFILLSQNSDLTIKTGQRVFGGFIYGPNADITLWSNAEVEGAIIANNFYANGNPSLDSTGINYNDYLNDFVDVPTMYEREYYSR